MSDIESKKRLRKTIVCSNCRTRKVKCNKESPCSSRIGLSIEQDCVYENNSESQKKLDSETEKLCGNIELAAKPVLKRRNLTVVNPG